MAKIGLCFSHLLSQGDTTRKAGVQEKKRRSTRKKFRAPIHRECVLRQSKHCDLSREDAEHTENTQTETETETESLLGGFSSVEGELCHFATTSNQCTEDTPVPETLQSPCPALLVLRCFPVQRVFNHQAPLICHLSGTFHGVENSSDTSHRSPRRRRRRRCHRSQARLSPLLLLPSPPPPFSSCLLRLHCRVFNLALTVLAFAFHRATSTSTELQLPLPLPFRSSLNPLERRHSSASDVFQAEQADNCSRLLSLSLHLSNFTFQSGCCCCRRHNLLLTFPSSPFVCYSS